MGVGFRQPVMMRNMSFSDTSRFLVWVLLSHTGAAYSATLNTMARAAVRRVVALAPHVEPVKHRIRMFRAVTFRRRSSMCCLYVSCLSNVTPRYFGCGLCGRMFPLTLIQVGVVLPDCSSGKGWRCFFSVPNLSRHLKYVNLTDVT